MASSTGQVCALPWCRQTGSHLTFQTFPENEIRQMQWLTLLDVADTWKDVPPEKLEKYVICNLHFDTRGTLLRAISTPLVTTAHISQPPVPTPVPVRSSSSSTSVKTVKPLPVPAKSIAPQNRKTKQHGYSQIHNQNTTNSTSKSKPHDSLTSRSNVLSVERLMEAATSKTTQLATLNSKRKGATTSDSEPDSDVEDTQEYKPVLPIPMNSKLGSSSSVAQINRNKDSSGSDPNLVYYNPFELSITSSDSDSLPLSSLFAAKKPRPAFTTPVPESGRWTRGSFSLGKKIEIVRHLESGMKQADVCRIFNLPKSTVWSIWKNREKIETAFMSGSPLRKKLRKSRFEDVDSALFNWYTTVSCQNIAVTSRLLQTMAETFAQDLGQTEFVCTAGWLERFKNRYCINLSAQKKMRKLEIENSQPGPHGPPTPEPTIEHQYQMEDNIDDSDNFFLTILNPNDIKASPNGPHPDDDDEDHEDTDPFSDKSEENFENLEVATTSSQKLTETDSSLPSALAKDWITHTWPKLRKLKQANTTTKTGHKTNEITSYSAANIFTAEETGILYRLSPHTAFKMYKNKTSSAKHSENQAEFKDFSIAKERITIMLCANSDGSEKKRLSVFSQCRKPDCIVSIIGENFSRLPVDYHPTTDETSWINEESFQSWLKTWDTNLREKENNRKILLTLSSSPIHCAIPKLTNIEVVLIPTQVTSLLQPMQQGIIREFKFCYRRLQLERMIYYLEQQKDSCISLFDALLMLSTAWCEICKEAIATCFTTAGIIAESYNKTTEYKFQGLDVTALIQRGVQLGLQIPPEWEFKDFVGVDDCLFAVDYLPTRNPYPNQNHVQELRIPAENETNAQTNETNCMEIESEELLSQANQSQNNHNPMSALTTSEIQIYLDLIKVWAMSKGSSASCPQRVHDALSTIESFAYDHLK